MTEFEAIGRLARTDLTIATEQGNPDLFLWKHAHRVALTAQRIVRLRAVRSEEPNVIAITAAAFYHDAGWSHRCRSGERHGPEILLGRTTMEVRERGAGMLRHTLGELLSANTVARATRAIRTMDEDEPDTVESKVLGEANALDQFGVLLLRSAVRLGALDGKGIQGAFDAWRKSREYGFWVARLRTAFRFAAVRSLARSRLAKFERLMEELEAQHQSRDIAVWRRVPGASVGRRPTTAMR